MDKHGATIIAALNNACLSIPGSDITFNVHSWGAARAHKEHQLHRHSFFEVCYVTGGAGIYLDDTVKYPINKGAFFLSRPGIWHKITSESGVDLVWVCFEIREDMSDPAVINGYQCMENFSNICIPSAEACPSALMWHALLQCDPAKKFFANIAVGQARALLLSFLHLFEHASGNDKPDRAVPDNASQIINLAKLYIRDNLSQSIQLKALANYLHLSERSLSRLFMAHLGQTFSHFLRNERIRQADTMLKTTIYSIKEIAEATGFYSVHHFTRVFKDKTGMAPAVYRKKVNHAHEQNH